MQRTRDGGAEIVKLLKTGLRLLCAGRLGHPDGGSPISLTRKRVLPCAAHLEGQYGVSGYYVGVPTVIGAGGVERIVEIELDPEEQAAFDQIGQQPSRALCAAVQLCKREIS